MRVARRCGAVVAGLLSVWGGLTDAPAQSFSRVLSMYGGAPPTTATWQAIRDLGFDAVSARDTDGARAAAAAKLDWYWDQIVGKGELELRPDQWQPIWDAYDRDRDGAALIRPGCLSDPQVCAAVDARLAAQLEALRVARAEGLRPPLGIALADEPSLTRHVNPLDLCSGPHCVAAFRAFLQLRYGGALGRLEAAWGVDFDDWSDVLPWTADRMRARESVGGSTLPRNLTPWNDHLAFRDQLFVATVRRLCQRVGGVAPVGITGMQPISAYGGYAATPELMASQSFWEAYPIGATDAVARCFAPRGALEIATLFPPKAGAPPGMLVAQLERAIARGSRGVVVWSYGDVLTREGEGGVVPTAFGAQVRDAFQATERIASSWAESTMGRDRIWILETPESVRAHWMVDSAGDGRTWTRRLSSYESAHSTSYATRRSWLALIRDLGFEPRFVDAATLLRRENARPAVLVLPAALAMSDAAVAAVREFVERDGGVVVADHGAAFYDDALKLRAKPALDALFGVARDDGAWAARAVPLPRVRQGRCSVPSEDAARFGLAEPGLRRVAGVSEPVGADDSIQFEHEPGRGKAVYFNLAVAEYAAARLDPDRHAASRNLRARMRRVLESAGLEPHVLVRAEGMPACLETTLAAPKYRGPGGPVDYLLAVRVAALDAPEMFEALVERGPRTLRVEFRREVQVSDARTGEELGTGKVFTREISPTAGVFLSIKGAIR